jgi:hypothetical protein
MSCSCKQKDVRTIRKRALHQVALSCATPSPRGLSALRRPVHHPAAPKCHTPSPWQLSAQRQPAKPGCLQRRFMLSPGGLPVLRRSARQISHSQLLTPQAESLAIQVKEAVMRKPKHQQATHSWPTFLARCASRQPNWSFNRDVTCCARAAR